MTKHELYIAARHAESPEALLNLAKENDIKVSLDECKELFLRLHKSSKVDPSSLSRINGGSMEDAEDYKEFEKVFRIPE